MQIGCGKKRPAPVTSEEEQTKKRRHINLEGPSTSSAFFQNVSTKNNDIIKCSQCDVLILKKNYKFHLLSDIHKNNVLQSDLELQNVEKIECAFGNRVITYRIKPKINDNSDNLFLTPELFLNNVKDLIFKLLDRCISDLMVVKVNFLLNADFTQETKNLFNSFDFQIHNYVFCRGDDKDIIYSLIISEISNKISNFEKKDSGWSLLKIKHMDMNVNKFNPLRGSSYIDLPLDIKHKYAVINVKNNDNECFRWAILSGLHPTNNNPHRLTNYLAHKNELKFTNLSFPIKITDINKFEKLNNLSINVFTLDYDSETKKNKVVGPLYFTKDRKARHVNLLYITNGVNGHYCYIKNLSRLVSSQFLTKHNQIYFCDGCLLNFTSNENLKKHQENDCFHIRTKLPSENDTKKNWFNELTPANQVYFNNYERKLRLPFVVYADFEAFLNPISGCSNNPSNSSTSNIHKHEVYSFGYYIKCSYNDSLSQYRSYTGKDCVVNFMKLLKKDLVNICAKLSFIKSPIPLTEANKRDITESSVCYICKKMTNDDSTICFNQFTGLYEGVGHKKCYKKYETPNFIPVFFHNLSNYDAHFIVHGLSFEEGNIELIPETKEKYISFSKVLRINNRNMKIRFLDSFKFMSCSLDKLAKNLTSDKFKELKLNFPNEDDFCRLIRKGIYPYEYMTSYECLKITSLPPPCKFYSSLNDTHISESDYQHAQDVWHHFNCKNMKEYSDLYLKTDVLLLADIFENFRNVCLKTYELDPVHYYTAPGLSWDAMLIYTKINLELLTDINKISFISNNIRGGISQCSNRHAKANNSYMSEYDSSKPSSFLMYLDANNLYGWAMSQCLPTGKFEWVDVNTNFDIADDASHGFILEVDLEYPTQLHDFHSDLPFCPENACFGGSKEKKLVPNLHNKKNYVIHYRNLKQCLKQGLRLIKVHRILKFQQSKWLKSYIDLNTQMRSLAKTDFEKDFYKLMNNSVFGKTMENVLKRINVKLVNHWENRGRIQGVQSLIARPEFHSRSVFSESLVAIQLKKTEAFYNKPIYLGFSILDLSKTLMYQFHYDFMKEKYNENIKLLYTDTDSFVYQIFTDNFYMDIKDNLDFYFDTSDYPSDNQYGFPLINKKRLGFFKDENNGKILKEFVGLRSKMYAMDIQNNFIARAKGVNKCVTKNFSLNNYKTCLMEKKIFHSEMLRFRSLKHTIFTQKINKISLSYNDTKRYILENGTDTLAWGHYKITNI